jgi:uncharacterized protein (TIGR02996 family)
VRANLAAQRVCLSEEPLFRRELRPPFLAPDDRRVSDSSTHRTADDGFLAAILEHPDDDLARLVYADWLEERGASARAEFIRIQVELAAQTATGPRRRALKDREARLEDEHHRLWRAGLPRLPGMSWRAFHRGFPADVEVRRWREFAPHFEELFRAAPVQFLRIAGIEPDAFAGFCASPCLANIRGLELRRSVGTRAMTMLAGCRWLNRLKWLIVRGGDGWQVGDAGARALVSSLYLDGLEILDLSFNAIGADTAEALYQRFGGKVRLKGQATAPQEWW